MSKDREVVVESDSPDRGNLEKGKPVRPLDPGFELPIDTPSDGVNIQFGITLEGDSSGKQPPVDPDK